MKRPLTAEERRLVAEEQALAAPLIARGLTTPYFARLRVRTGAGERDVLLGARTLAAEPAVVVDWQTAPLAAVFFAAEEGDEYEYEHDGRTLTGTVLRRHRVEFTDGSLRALVRPGALLRRDGDEWRAHDDAGPRLRPRAPEQQRRAAGAVELDEVQRGATLLPATRSLLVLGEAGFGKTTVALHRLAHLARTAGAGFRSLVIVPTPGLQRLTARLLADLEVPGVTVETFNKWVHGQARRVFPELPARLAERSSPQVRRFKRHPALRTALPQIVAGTAAMRAVRAGYRDRPETIRDLLLHLFGDRELLARVVDAADGDLPPAAIDELLAHTRVQFCATSERALAHVDRERLRTLDGRAIDEGTPMHDAGTVDIEDLAVVFALHHRGAGDPTRRGGLTRYHHIVLDEAQELAPIELELLGRAVAPGGTVTVAGDGQQQVDASTRFAGWPAVLAELGRADPNVVTLAISYRCPQTIEDLARAVLDPAAGPRPDPTGAPVLLSRHAHPCHQLAALADALLALQEHDPRASVAIVCRHPETARRLHAQLERALPARLVLDGEFCFRPGVDVTCVHEVKGLEFDVVIVPDLDAATYPDEPAARRALYVALTRPLHQLWLASPGPWSPLLPRWLARP